MIAALAIELTAYSYFSIIETILVLCFHAFFRAQAMWQIAMVHVDVGFWSVGIWIRDFLYTAYFPRNFRMHKTQCRPYPHTSIEQRVGQIRVAAQGREQTEHSTGQENPDTCEP